MEAVFRFITLIFALLGQLMFRMFLAGASRFSALYPPQNNFMAHYERIALAFLIPAATLLVIGT